MSTTEDTEGSDDLPMALLNHLESRGRRSWWSWCGPRGHTREALEDALWGLMGRVGFERHARPVGQLVRLKASLVAVSCEMGAARQSWALAWAIPVGGWTLVEHTAVGG